MDVEYQEDVKVEFNLFDLKKDLEKQKGKEYSWTEMAEAAGLHHNTVARIARNQTDRIDLKTIGGLVKFFRSEGMEVGVKDLIKVTVQEKAAA